MITGHNTEDIDLLHAIVYGYIDAIKAFIDFTDLCNDRIQPMMMA